MHECLWLFVAAHVAFLVLGMLILNDVCTGPDTFPLGKDKSVLGLEYISEKIMVCHYATSRWACCRRPLASPCLSS